MNKHHCRDCQEPLWNLDDDLCGRCADKHIARYNENREWNEFHTPDPSNTD